MNTNKQLKHAEDLEHWRKMAPYLLLILAGLVIVLALPQLLWPTTTNTTPTPTPTPTPSTRPITPCSLTNLTNTNGQLHGTLTCENRPPMTVPFTTQHGQLNPQLP